jgi:hypothetical protein
LTEEFQIVESKEFNFLIKKKTDEYQPLLGRMEELRLQFVNEVVIFAAKWYEETARLYVAKHSEITLNMSKEKLASMKACVNNLIRNAEKTVTSALSGAEVWWHMAPTKNSQQSMYEQFDNRFPETVDKAVRRVLGELGGILEEFGYSVTVGGSNKWSYPEFWFESSKDPETAVRPFYPHLLQWSEQMQVTIRRYSEIYKRALALVNEIEYLKEETKKQKARDLWDIT